MTSTHCLFPAVWRRIRAERGTALVEFAICTTLFLALVYGSITYGVVFWVKHTLTAAASEGARAALSAPILETCELSNPYCNEKKAAKDKADQVAADSLGDRATHIPTIAPTVSTCAGSTRDCITVTVQYPYDAHPILPSLLPMLFVPDTISSTSVLELSS